MNRTLNIFYRWVFAAMVLWLAGCIDSKAVIDQNTAVASHNWLYLSKFKYDVKIDDPKAAYNLYLNLRITAAYKYSNLFVLIQQAGPDRKTKVNRYELKLAGKDGEWFGQGSGNLYTYQVPFRTNYKFAAKGVYHFYIEQNMRDNPLREVSDVGLRVEKSQ